MKAIRIEVYLRPQYINAAMQYLNTDATLFMTALQNGVMLVVRPKQADKDHPISQAIANLKAFVAQYTQQPVVVVQTSCNIEQE